MAKSRIHHSFRFPLLTLVMIGNVSKHVISSVIHLPKKFSCTSDNVSSPQERVVFPSEVQSNHSGLNHSSCTTSTWDLRTEKDFGNSEDNPPAAMQSNEVWMGKPILPSEQLEAALSRTSLALDEVQVPHRQKAQRPPSLNVAPQNTLSPTKNTVVSRTPSSTSSNEVYFRPLSPPPDHFRRRNGQQPVSPPTTPRPSHMAQRPRTVSLHQVLSNESLPAGQGDVPDVPPIGETMREHRSRAVSRESVVYRF